MAASSSMTTIRGGASSVTDQRLAEPGPGRCVSRLPGTSVGGDGPCERDHRWSPATPASCEGGGGVLFATALRHHGQRHLRRRMPVGFDLQRDGRLRDPRLHRLGERNGDVSGDRSGLAAGHVRQPVCGLPDRPGRRVRGVRVGRCADLLQ